MRGKNLDIAPRETDEVWLEFGRRIADRSTPLVLGKEGEIQNTLPHLRFASMDKVSEISHPDGVDLFARKKDVENRIHSAISYQPSALDAES